LPCWGQQGTWGLLAFVSFPERWEPSQASAGHWAGHESLPLGWMRMEREGELVSAVASGEVGSATGIFLRWLIYTEWGSWDLLINCKKRESW